MGRLVASMIILFLSPLLVSAQETASRQERFLEAEYFFMNEDYGDALPVYLQLLTELPGNSNLSYRTGVCYLNMPGKKNLAIPYLETAVRKMSAKIKEGSVLEENSPYDALFELATAYRINYMFDKARECFSRYSETLLPDDRGNLDFIRNEIAVCDNAGLLIDNPVSFTEENIGSPFNTADSEFNPLISADGGSFAYMTSEKFYDAIMFSRLEEGKWTPPLNITANLLSDGDSYISCLSSDGRQLLFSKDDDYNSDIFLSSFDGVIWGRPVKLNRNINTKYWESHGYISEDGNQMVFVSDRPGGYGGLDLYISQKVNGDWGAALNLGPVVNTPFNEDRPFLVNNSILFFSSQGHRNMGGYDIFRATLQPGGLWSVPENIGYPLNDTDDNFFFMPCRDGRSGYYSIFRESGGAGSEDIYRITFTEK